MAIYWLVYIKGQQEKEQERIQERKIKRFEEVFEKRGMVCNYLPKDKLENGVEIEGSRTIPYVFTLMPITEFFFKPEELEEFLRRTAK